MTPTRRSRIAGALLGTAVGDSLGLPREGLSPGRARVLFGDVLEHRFLLRRGMLSDDTEHACMVAQAFLASGGDAERFSRSFAWRLRGWLLGLPAGIGMGTARALFKLWLGFPPSRSGVGSAGNAPAMRSALLGLLIDDPGELRVWVEAATRITHTDPRAESAALLVAIAAQRGIGDHDRLLDAVPLEVIDDEFAGLLDAIDTHMTARSSVAEFAAALGLTRGVTGYAYHTVPVALFAALRHPGDFRAAVTASVALGGDADTVGAITGAIAGAAVGVDGIPSEWLDGIRDAPRSVAWLRRLADRLDVGGRPLPLAWPLIPFRNLAFLIVVLGHGFRRLLPPYAVRAPS